ncbi:undecaprenyl-diphosphate phosphatase [Buchnera aphidicola]|uniref:Undecaprenyl-diphosphatase n=1 Tax=Buchnera aphidicola (Lipaphis pseudobrassicae) TaxID=1258543 RepID=A0A4D6XZY5_9GAMM|nr:undecaprenyl-diphosphate phosphatase [Buchnera aphidicola]QCI21957.1 undecaprenyl-diphosphate phosphatase [Buchnera aphidicola (Lipaphis pseudobrassicae)]
MIDLNHIFIYIILGTIEGITEFLPISSTGHMIIISHWLNVESNNTKILSMFMQFGSALAIFYFFYKKILRILNVRKKYQNQNTKCLHILFSILPTILLGLIFYKKIQLTFNINCIIYTLILGGFFLIISEMLKPKKHITSNIRNINLFQSIIIGLLQIFSLYPGVSRSGITIATGILLGIKRSVAIEFSFIISIPLLMGASFFEIVNNIHNIKKIDLLICLFSFIISYLISTLFIKKLLKFIKNTSMIFFGIYRLILALLLYFIH